MPGITDVRGNVRRIEECGYEIVGHFPLPEASWRMHFYHPRAANLPAVRTNYYLPLLWLLVLLTIIAASHGHTVRIETQLVRSQVDLARARSLAEAGIPARRLEEHYDTKRILRFLLLRAPAVLSDFAGEGWRVIKGSDGKAEAYFLVARQAGLLRGRASRGGPLFDERDLPVASGYLAGLEKALVPGGAQPFSPGWGFSSSVREPRCGPWCGSRWFSCRPAGR